MATFSVPSAVQKLIAYQYRHGYSLDQLYEVLNTNGDGVLKVPELSSRLQDLGIPFDSNNASQNIRTMTDYFDRDGDGIIEKAELRRILERHMVQYVEGEPLSASEPNAQTQSSQRASGNGVHAQSPSVQNEFFLSPTAKEGHASSGRDSDIVLDRLRQSLDIEQQTVERLMADVRITNVDREDRELMMQRAIERLEKELHASRTQYTEDLERMREAYRNEVLQISERHKQDVQQMHAWMNQQLRNLQHEKEEAMTSAQREHLKTIDAINQSKLQELKKVHEHETAELRKMLEEERSQLSSLRAEYVQLGTEKTETVAHLKEQLSQQRRARDEEKSTWRNQVANLMAALERKGRLEKEILKMDLRREQEKATALQRDFEQLRTEFELLDAPTRAELVDRSAAAMSPAAKKLIPGGSDAVDHGGLREEVDSLRNDLLLCEAEHARLKAENKQYRKEIKRLDRFVYGRNSKYSKTTKGTVRTRSRSSSRGRSKQK